MTQAKTNYFAAGIIIFVLGSRDLIFGTPSGIEAIFNYIGAVQLPPKPYIGQVSNYCNIDHSFTFEF